MLKSLELHNNKLITKSAQGRVIDVTSIDNWITEPSKVMQPPISETAVDQAMTNEIVQDEMEANEFEKPSEYDPKDIDVLPKPESDYRSLLEPQSIYALSLEEQLTMRMTQILPAFNEALIQADSNRRFSTLQENSQLKRYYEGIYEALKDVRDKIMEGQGLANDLYVLLDELKQKGTDITAMFIGEQNELDNNYARAYHEGLAAGYINSASKLEAQLKKEEQWRHKKTFIPVTGGN